MDISTEGNTATNKTYESYKGLCDCILYDQIHTPILALECHSLHKPDWLVEIGWSPAFLVYLFNRQWWFHHARKCKTVYVGELKLQSGDKKKKKKGGKSEKDILHLDFDMKHVHIMPYQNGPFIHLDYAFLPLSNNFILIFKFVLIALNAICFFSAYIVESCYQSWIVTWRHGDILEVQSSFPLHWC